MSVLARILVCMALPDELSVLEAAVAIWDEAGHGATPAAIAARLNADEDSVQRMLAPFATPEYFGNVLRGDDQVQVVREPTAATRRLAGSNRES